MMHLYTVLCGVFHLSAVVQSGTVKQDTGVRSATVGDNVTLQCFYDSQVAMQFSWYRQPLGSKPELLTTIYKHEKPSKDIYWVEKSSRFFVQKNEGINHLHISDVHLSDSAMYYCATSHSNMIEFGDGVFLSVEGTKNPDIVQEPESETIQPGGAVTFNCTVHTGACNGEHRVYWFRYGSHQGTLHTHRDQCKAVSAPESPSRICVYHLQKMNLSYSDAGTYYCAVASCGEILFGSGSKLLIRDDVEDQEAQIRTLAWLSIVRAGILLFVFTVCLFVFVSKRCGSP